MDEIRWMGGQPTPEHQAYKKQVATDHLERFAASFPRPDSNGMALPQMQSANSVTWTNIGPTKGVSTYSGINNPDIDSGRISPNGLAISPDGQTLYLASSNGGLWKTSTANRANADATWTWTPLTDSLPIASSTGNVPIGAVALSPSGNNLFIGAGDFAASYGKGFYRSTDGGRTWTETAKADLCGLYASDYISCILPLDDNTILAGGNAGLYRSTDGGATFGVDAIGNRVLGSNGYGDRIWSVEQVGNSSQNLVASLQITGTPSTGTAWYSSDGGTTWNQAAINGVSLGVNSAIGRITLKSNKASGNLNVWGIAQVTPGRAMLKGILRSTDGGRNYTYVADASSPAMLFSADPAHSTDGQQGEYNQCLAVSQSETTVVATKVFTGSNCGFYRSSDGGSTWTWMTNWYSWTDTPVYSHADKHAAIWSPDGSALYVGTDGGLSVFWDPFRATPPIRQAGNPPLTDATFVDNRHNEGLSTHLVYHLGSTAAAAPLDASARVIIGLQDNSTRRRTGSTLASSTQFDEAYSTGDGFGTLIHKLDGNKLIVSGVGVNIGYSLDGGNNFLNGNGGIDTTGGAPFHTRVEPGRADATGNTAYTASNYKLFKSTNFGQSWSACAMGGFPTSYPSPYIRNFNTSSLDPLKLAIVDATDCWISADGGASWTDKGPVYAAGGVEMALGYIWFDSTNDSILYAASAYAGWGPTIQHLWRSADGGSTWQNIEGGNFPSGHGVNFGGPVHIIQNDPTNSATLLAGTDFGIYVSTNSGATWSRYGVGLPMVGVHDFFIAPDGSFIRAATYGRGIWESTGSANNPQILASPVDTTAYQGLDTSFSVQASGAFSFQWQVNYGSGWVNLSNGAPYSYVTTAALSITAVPAGLSGYHYRVVVTGVTGASSPATTSAAALLTVVLPPSPTIQGQPVSTTLASGANGSFTVLASWVTSYQWQVNTGSGWTPLTNSAPYSGSTTATLTIIGATLGMSTYQYRVVLTGSAAANPLTATSTSATLTVVTAPSFTSQPVNATIAVGANASFTATVNGATSYRWQSKVGAGTWTDVSDGGVYTGATTVSLTITAATSGLDGTTYRLIATGPLALTATSASVTLLVKDPAAITVQPVGATGNVNVQNANIFSVVATGYSLSHQWQIYSGGVWSNITDAANYGGITSASLSIWVSGSMNGNQYRVIVTGAVGPAVTSSAATLAVNCVPNIGTQPLDTTLATNGTGSLSISATNCVGYSWSLSTNNGASWATLSTSTAPYSIANTYGATATSTLTITNAPVSMNGYKYRALAAGTCGNTTSSVATLYVGATPAITGQPANASIATNANASFAVTATASLSYQWQVNTGGGFTNLSNGGIYSGATSAILSITGATLGLSGNTYQVIVTGLASQTVTSNVVTLTVNDPPSISGQPANATVTAGSGTSFTVNASGTSLSYQWRVNIGAGYANVTNGGSYSGATTATLILSNVTAAMSGYLYQVVVTGVGAVSVTSAVALLTVNIPPSISGQPSNATVTAGGNTSFSVSATGTGLAYQWQVNPGSGFVNVTNGGVYSGASTATLSIIGATAGLGGYSYQVVVSGAAAPPAISTPASLTVNVPPSISGQPSNASVTTGGNTSFSVTATGTGLTYQWQANTGSGFGNVSNGAPYSGATTATLSITGATAGMTGYQYQVVVSGAAAPPATSNPATLTVNVPPNISGQPSNATVTAGGNTSFSITATGSSLTYQWQVNPGSGFGNVTDGGVYSGATTATLSITGATAGMSGYSYQVVVSGTVAPPATSSPATLTVNVLPSISAQPGNATVAANGNTSFTVSATGTSLTYQWQVNPGSGFVNVTNGGVYSGASTATLNITCATAGMSGSSYQVVVSGVVAPPATSSQATLTVNLPPSISGQPSNATVTAGGNTSFSVTATGTSLTHQWQVNPGSGFVNITNGGVYSGATTATLTITGATADMSGYSYQVLVSGLVNPVATSSAAALTVNVPPGISTQPQNQVVAAGSPVTFSIIATGTAPLTYQWRKGGSAIPGQVSPSYTIASTVVGDSGTYDVLVTNLAGSAGSTVATLTVNPAPPDPSISLQPQSQSVVAGSPAVFSVAATGTSPLTYQWRKGGINLAGQTASSYTIAATVLGDAGNYDVVVSSAAGNANSAVATLTVNPAPVAPGITTPPQSQVVTSGTPVTFTVAATGTAPLAYQWRKGGINLAGQTASSYAIAATVVGDAGSFDVVVSNTAGRATSAAALLTVNPAPVAPGITTQPQNQVVTAGSPVTFMVVASGTAPLVYQWLKNGSGVAGATTSTYASTASLADNAAVFSVTVSNAGGLATSAAAILTVNLKSSDLNADGVVSVLDLAFFFRSYAPGVPAPNSPADLNGDGYVDEADLALLLAGM
jgi:hypothetical protein